MTIQDWVWLLLAIPAIMACIAAYQRAEAERLRYRDMLKEDDELVTQLFGPECRCGHRVSQHVSAGVEHTASAWCRVDGCKCGDYMGAE